MLEEREFSLNIGDVELSVVEWLGEGDPVLLLHATGFHGRCWHEVVKCLPGRHVYAVDLRFHGKSSSTGGVSWQLMTDDIRILIEKLQLTNQMISASRRISRHVEIQVKRYQLSFQFHFQVR